MSNTSLSLFTARSAYNFYNPLADVANNNYVLFAGRQEPWPDDFNPPAPDKSVKTLDYDIFDEMIFAVAITQDDVNLMINNNPWVSNTVYAMYDHTDPNLYDEKFFVVSQENGAYHVFKCLNNNGGVPSTSQPLATSTGPADAAYYTADGYQWKYMYSIPKAVYNQFATNSYVPLLPDQTVASYAVNGAIDAVKVSYGGNGYFSYTNGHFQDVNLDGNVLVHLLDASGVLQVTIKSSNGTFNFKDTVVQGSMSAVVAGSNSTTLFLSNVNGQVAVGQVLQDTSTNATANVVSVYSSGPSSNNGFYDNCAIYIQDGTGAGQVRRVVDYSVVGTQRIVTIDSAFSPGPDYTSHYLICPAVNIQGDGTGAQAISTVNTATWTISGIQMVSRGQNYSYANVTIVGNTNSTNAASSTANAYAIISPRGGHGSNPATELGANKVGVSVTFQTTENGTIPAFGINGNTEYRRAGIVEAPQLANVTAWLANSTGVFQPGEQVIQYRSANVSLGMFTANVQQYTYVVGNYVQLQFANASPFSNGQIIAETYPYSGQGLVLSTSGNTAFIRVNSGGFSNSSTVIKLGNSAVNVAVTAANQAFTNSVYSLDASNNQFLFNPATESLTVFLNGVSILPNADLPANTTQTSWTANSSAISIVNYGLSNTDVVSAQLTIPRAAFSNVQYAGIGTVVQSNATFCQLTDVQGYVIAGAGLVGTNSGFSANVSSVTAPSATFNQTTRLIGDFQTANTFAVGDQVWQKQGNTVTATGIVQGLTQNSSSSLLLQVASLSGVFEVGEPITQTTTTANGVVLAANSSTIQVYSESSANFANGYVVVGTYSGASANVANATPIVNTYFSVALTHVKGNFNSISLNSSANCTVQSNTCAMLVNDLFLPDLVRYTGNVVYVEDFVPIVRANNQSETVKLVLNFY